MASWKERSDHRLAKKEPNALEKMVAARSDDQAHQIIDLAKQGLTVGQISMALKVDEREVSQVLGTGAAGIKPPRDFMHGMIAQNRHYKGLAPALEVEGQAATADRYEQLKPRGEQIYHALYAQMKELHERLLKTREIRKRQLMSGQWSEEDEAAYRQLGQAHLALKDQLAAHEQFKDHRNHSRPGDMGQGYYLENYKGQMQEEEA